MTTFLGLILASVTWARPVVFVPLDPLQPYRPVPRERAPVPWVADRLRVEIEPGVESRLTLSWTLSPLEPSWVDLPLLGAEAAVAEATLDGRPLKLEEGPDGMRHALIRLERPATLRVVASLPTPAAALDLRVAEAARQEVQAPRSWELSAPGAVPVRGGLSGGEAGRLHLEWRPAGPRPPKPTVLRAESVSALRLDSAGLEASARLSWRVSNGSVDSVSFALPADVEGLEVSGDGVAEIARQGETVRVSLARPVSDQVSLRVRYRAPAASRGESALPLPWPQANEASGYTSLLRADEALIVPVTGAGAEAVSPGSLPARAQGLAEGTPLAAYRLSGEAPSVLARVVAWEPIEGPPTVIDEARYEIANADHGRLLLRARFQVRNDRRQFLRLTVPPGLELISVTVAGRAAQVGQDAQGHLLIPLEKSVETLAGLVTFPVDIAFYGDDSPWLRRGLREVRTPSVDAPIAYARWELVLPPGFHAREATGNVTRVATWSSRERGLSYGRSYGETLGEDAPVVANEEVSQALWNQAYSAYKAGNYRESKELLDQSLSYDASNQAAAALSRNVDVLLDTSGSASAGRDEAATRRVREMASARSADIALRADELEKKAEEAERAGDDEAAERALEELVQVSGTLAGLEQAEQVARKMGYADAQAKLEKLKKKDAPSSSRVAYKQQTEIDLRRATREPDVAGLSDAWRAAAREKRQDSMEFLKQIIAERNPQGEQRAEMMLRLANLYDEEARDRMQAEVEALELCLENPGCDVDTATIEHMESRKFSDKAEKLYRQIRDSYPTYVRMDEVEAALARIEEERAIWDPVEVDDEIPVEDLPVPEGQAMVIAVDQEALWEAQNLLVYDPDIYALLTASDVAWTGEEDLHIERVERGLGARGSGYGGGGTAEGYGGLGTKGRGRGVGAVSASVPIPRSGQSLFFEARLVPEGQPLSISLSFAQERRERR